MNFIPVLSCMFETVGAIDVHLSRGNESVSPTWRLFKDVVTFKVVAFSIGIN